MTLAQKLSEFPQNYNARALMNMAFSTRFLQSEISLCSEIAGRENYLHLSVLPQQLCSVSLDSKYLNPHR